MHAFVTYDDIRDAEDAKRELDKTEYAAPVVGRADAAQAWKRRLVLGRCDLSSQR